MREIYDTMWGKYNSRLAHYVDSNFELFDKGDNYTCWPDMGEGALLIGKRILWWDDRGFVNLDRYKSTEDAERVWRQYDLAGTL